ncbi:DUF5695 domain-containing protein [Allosphingosinicella deserti]|uniref:Uncharacterized protein n=1 Tax=Allosphingosinicella deserti TaxID=2116704 RepID=A0A2P7QNA5_9SPHN|nr:DUF5695 domain-containing protein [Sphingomonas deserti]PSJ39436.1 hypothetical protein C7I55_12525 [Sphingomonas deserti]
MIASRWFSTAALIVSVAAVPAIGSISFAAPPRAAKPAAAGDAIRRVGPFQVAFRRDTGTLARLSPATEPAFDFVPSGRAAERSADGYVHLGDLHLRVRTGKGDWRDFSSAYRRRTVRALGTAGATLSASDITASMGEGIPLSVERHWVDDNGVFALRFTLTNRGSAPVEVGGLGMPMVFDNIITDRSLEQAHAGAVFVDPYVGADAGYLQVTRLNGKGPALLVVPEKGTPLEAYSPIVTAKEAPDSVLSDRSPRAQTAEGFYDWLVASKGFAEREWKAAGEQWNPPTAFTLAPGESRTIGIRFLEAPAIRAIEQILADHGRPVAVGLPGYVVPTDQPALLFLKSRSPVHRIESHPAGALTATVSGSVNGWQRYAVSSKGWGRARLSIIYADGSVGTIHYFVTKPLEQLHADLGRFSTTRQWTDDARDPFGRAPAILTYDREANEIVTQDHRVWIAGMSDEGGGGSWLAAIMKQLDNPDAGEVAKLERLIDETIVGKLQVADGPHAGGVRKSLFYYDPIKFPDAYDKDRDWTTWASWKKAQADDLGRSYNYPHVAAGHWVLYRLARNHQGLVRRHDWRWYLERAFQTSVAMMRDAPHYAQFGQMEGDIFVDILKDLKRENLAKEAAEMERLMRGRAEHWRTLAYPFGSEMAWDSTGQAEVYAWMRFFGWQKQADTTREVILGYDPTVPHWGYNGNARRYWDFLYAGKFPRIERQIHHYGSTLNAIPLFDAYRADPSDFHLLRVAYGGLMGGITNVDREGFSSAGFHSWPDRMAWDPYSGDYGMGYFGHVYAAATYLVDHPAFGWLGFGGTAVEQNGTVRIAPKDGARSRLFVAPAGAWLTLEAGKISSATYAPATGTIELVLDPATATTPLARLRIETTTKDGRRYRPDRGTEEREAYSIGLTAAPTRLVLTPR